MSHGVNEVCVCVCVCVCVWHVLKLWHLNSEMKMINSLVNKPVFIDQITEP